MNKISQPFVRYLCLECFRQIERQISARHAEKEINDMREGPDLRCAECEANVVLARGQYGESK